MKPLKQLGRYQVVRVRVLGRGAMGEVYEGLDPRLNRSVAIKVISTAAIADPELRATYSARLIREAQAVARLNHPHIVALYDFGEENGIAYMVMELVRGEELVAYFDMTQDFHLEFTLEDAVRMSCELRDALACADLRPACVVACAGNALDPDATWQDEHMPAIIAVHDAVDAANARAYRANVQNGHGEGGGMGTTLTGFWQSQPGGPLIVFHVGDSRLYRYRAGELAVLTRDQTMYQQALEAGLSDDLPPRKLLLQAIGPTPDVTPDVKVCDLQPGDLYLLCSDGLYGSTPHAAIQQAMADAHAQSLDACCAELVELAKRHGSRDNVTAVLTLVES